MSKIYISGKITGLPLEEVKEKFEKAEKILIAQGYEVVNPTRNGIPESEPWDVHVAFDIVAMLGCSAVYLLQDWPYSKGATIEKSVAEIAGKEIIYEKNPLDVDLMRAIHKVADASFHDIVSSRRSRKLVYARMIYAYLSRKSGASLTDIAAEISRNHSTITYYLRKFEDEVTFNKKFRELLSRIELALSRTESHKITIKYKEYSNENANTHNGS
jgi:DNA-binding MarR family transcriptional regulator